MSLTENFDDFLEYIVSSDAGRGAPRHRVWEELTDPRYRDNVKAKNRACYRLTKLIATDECDEYPFASVHEGAGRNDAGVLTANVSYKFLTGLHNSSAGTALRWFYQRYRLFEKDPFWILISPGAEPAS